jgi:hypothetical protein
MHRESPETRQPGRALVPRGPGNQMPCSGPRVRFASMSWDCVVERAMDAEEIVLVTSALVAVAALVGGIVWILSIQ